MKKTAMLILVLLAGASLASAQSIQSEVTATAGGSASTPSHQVGWTLGETVVETFSSSSALLTQGFHQGEILVTELADELPAFELTVFPNPASERLFAEWENERTPVEFRFSDLNGRELFHRTVPSAGRAEFDLSQYASGNYILSALTADGTAIKQFKVQVIR